MRSREPRRRAAAVAMVFLAMAGLGSSAAQGASGLKSTKNGNYSQDHNSIKQVKACDMASDGSPVYAQYTPIGSNSVNSVSDRNGANNACESTGIYTKKIYKHRIGIEIAVLPDSYGSWRYPS